MQHGPMTRALKTYPNLELQPEEPIRFMAEVALAAKHPWTFDAVRSEEVRCGTGSATWAFVLDGNDDHPTCAVFVDYSGVGAPLWVSNIVPSEGQLDPERYGEILRKFAAEVLGTHPQHEEAAIVMTSGIVDLSVILSSESYRLLKSFSASANRNGFHPNDRERFYDFVISLHMNREALDEETFVSWLEKVENWHPNQTDKLYSMYNTALGVLHRYTQG